MNVFFEYKKSEITIQCKLDDKMMSICQKFSNKIGESYDSKIYIYKGKVLNLDSTLGQTTKLTENSTNKIKIIVYDSDKDMIKIKYCYEGENNEIVLSRGEKILKRVTSIIQQPLDKIGFLINGAMAMEEDLNKDFEQLANRQNIEDKEINFLVIDKDPINENENEDEQKKDDKDKEKEKKVIKNPRSFLLKMYSILSIQHGLISLFTWLGFYFNIEEKFTESLSSNLWTFIPITIISLIIGLISDEIKQEKYKKSNFIYFPLSVYVPIITFYCFLLSQFIKNKNFITLSLIFFFIVNLCTVIYFSIFKRYRGYGIFFPSLVFNVIITILFYNFVFDEIENMGLSITIMIILIIAFNMYIMIFNLFIKKLFKEDFEFAYATMYFNYLIFIGIIYFIILIIIGIAILIFFIIVIIGFIIFGLVISSIVIFASFFGRNIY